MRKLEEFKMQTYDLLSENELSKINGGIGAATSRYTCWTETASSGCTDIRCEKTIDEGSTTTTTSYETDN